MLWMKVALIALEGLSEMTYIGRMPEKGVTGKAAFPAVLLLIRAVCCE